MSVGASITTTTYANAMKVIYPQKRMETIFYKKHVISALMPKAADFFGIDGAMKIKVQHAVPSGGRSPNFQKAQAYRSTGAEVEFTLTRRSDYQIARLENEVIEASANNMGALMSVLKNKMDGAMRNLARQYQLMLWGNGGGSRGVVSTIGNGDGTNDLITLATIDDIVGFEQDMALHSDEDDGTGSATDTSDVFYVGKVDRSAGQLYIVDSSGSAIDVTTLTNPVGTSDDLFQDGDFGAVIQGVPAWIPYTLESSTFNSVTRSVDRDRLAGVSYDASTDPIEEGIKKLAVRINRNEGSPRHGFLNSIDWSTLELSLQTRVRYADVKAPTKASIGFTGIEITTAAGPLAVLPDRDTPRSYHWQLQMDGWKFHSLGGVPHQKKVNGGRTMTVQDADDEEFRQVYRGNTRTETPAYNGVALIAS